MRLRAWAALALFAAALAGCEHVQPRLPKAIAPPPPQSAPAPAPPAPEPEPKIVHVPVKCVPEDLGPPPSYPDSDAALRDAGGAADRYQLLAAGRLLRDARLKKLEDVVHRCRAAQARGR